MSSEGESCLSSERGKEKDNSTTITHTHTHSDLDDSYPVRQL